LELTKSKFYSKPPIEKELKEISKEKINWQYKKLLKLNF